MHWFLFKRHHPTFFTDSWAVNFTGCVRPNQNSFDFDIEATSVLSVAISASTGPRRNRCLLYRDTDKRGIPGTCRRVGSTSCSRFRDNMVANYMEPGAYVLLLPCQIFNCSFNWESAILGYRCSAVPNVIAFIISFLNI